MNDVLIATGTTGRPERGPAVLLLAETAAALVATVENAILVTAAGRETATASGWHVATRELVLRAAVGTLFGIHTVRFRIYLAPGSGLRRAIPADPWALPQWPLRLRAASGQLVRARLAEHRPILDEADPGRAGPGRWVERSREAAVGVNLAGTVSSRRGRELIGGRHGFCNVRPVHGGVMTARHAGSGVRPRPAMRAMADEAGSRAERRDLRAQSPDLDRLESEDASSPGGRHAREAGARDISLVVLGLERNVSWRVGGSDTP